MLKLVAEAGSLELGYHAHVVVQMESVKQKHTFEEVYPDGR